MSLENNPLDATRESNLHVLQIPLDSERHTRTYRQAVVRIDLPAPLIGSVYARFPDAQDRLAFFLSVYAAWIYRFSGETEAAIGTTGANRLSPIFIYASLQAAPSFTELYHAVRAELDKDCQPAEADKLPETYLTLDRQVPDTEHALLSWTFIEELHGTALAVEYDASLLRKATVYRYAEGYRTLMQAVLADPSRHVGAIPILTEHERSLYDRLSDTAFPFPEESTMHGMVELAAARFPNRPAISAAALSCTYSEMNERANRIAHLLLSSGLRKGDFVTLFMERSLDTIVSLLAVMKAGGAYVPVDPEYPEDRIRYILGDTKAAYVLTKRSHENRAQELTKDLGTVKAVIRVDEDSAWSGLPASNPDACVQPDDLAYVIYTSGSTGKPKGTMLAHRGAVNLGAFIRDKFAVTEHDVLTQFATFSFDASVWETVSALYAGAHLVLLSAEERVSVEAFADAVSSTGATLVPAVPTVFFNQLAVRLSEEGFRKLGSVRAVMTAGEALYGEQVRYFQAKSHGLIDIYNLYGPTECTVGTTFHRISQPIPDQMTHIPIGTPNGNYRVYVVNNELQLCPLHVPGELLIASVGLAKGYLNQPGKTADAFIPNPLLPGETVYRSGDIVKLLKDGTIEYVTRRDSQVKIRGHRIELGAVEDYMAKYPSVQDTAAIAVKEADGQQSLVGYYTTRDGAALPSGELRSFLLEKLPSYYVPRRLVHLEAMPLSPTGKVERKLLAAYRLEPEATEQPVEDNKLPHTLYHKRIAEAWQQPLGRRQFSIEDDFFQIGGDSLAVIQVLVHLKPYCPALTIQDLFGCKTMAELASRMEELDSFSSHPAHLQQPSCSARPGGLTILRELPSIPGEHGSLHGGQPGVKAASGAKPSCVLLTGGTGYLGSHLLYELLKTSQTRVLALVRPSGGLTGEARLEETMHHYFGESVLALMKQRVQTVEGSFSLPGLGLPDEASRGLLAQVDAILHAAADVRHFGSAEQFELANVEGTRRLLAWAESKPGVRFHHISTIGVPEALAFEGKWSSVEVFDGFAPELRVENVYTNSKLEAEKLVLDAAKRGLSVSIYRPANLTCHSVTGKFQRNIDGNAFYRMFKAMLLLGKAPKADWLVDLTPIDYASSAIVELVMQPDAAGHVYHICNPEPLPYSRLIEYVNQYGYSVETLEPGEYKSWLLDPQTNASQEALALAMAQLEGDGAKDSEFQYGCERTRSRLGGQQQNCAAPDLALVKKLIAYAVYIGYFPVPQRRSRSHSLIKF